jgi:PrtD family type I secretion system ABC transporter
MRLNYLFSSSDPLGRALRLCRPHLIAVAAFSAFLNLLYLAPTLYMLQVYDRVLPTNGGVTLVMVSAILAFALATLSCLDWLRLRLLTRCAARMDLALAGPVIREVLSQRSLSRIERTRLVRDFDTFKAVMSGGVALAVFDAPWLAIYMAAAFLLHPAVGALCVVGAVAMFGLAYLNEKMSGQALTDANTASAAIYARQDQVSASAAEVRALGMVEAMVSRQLTDRASAAHLLTKANFSAGYVTGAIKFLRLALQSTALGLAAWLAIKGQISAGSLMAASFLLARAVGPVEQIVGSWKGIVSARDAYGSLRKLFASAAPDAARTNLPAPQGRLTLEGVTVLPPSGERPSLIDVNMAVNPGELIGIVGPSGSGKSTLIRVLAGAVEPVRGFVRFDGASRLDWDPEKLARYIGYMPQEFVLFSGSIKENIAHFESAFSGDSAVVDARVIEAAKAAGAHELILRLPHGYDTPLGLGGVGLSGGQTQRIALARALYGSPPILMLDEPNAHLDSEGEAVLGQTLARLKSQGVTILVAAHRGTVLANADRVLVMSGGRVQSFGDLSETRAAMRSGDRVAPASAVRRTA